MQYYSYLLFKIIRSNYRWDLYLQHDTFYCPQGIPLAMPSQSPIRLCLGFVSHVRKRAYSQQDTPPPYTVFLSPFKPLKREIHPPNSTGLAHSCFIPLFSIIVKILKSSLKESFVPKWTPFMCTLCEVNGRVMACLDHRFPGTKDHRVNNARASM